MNNTYLNMTIEELTQLQKTLEKIKQMKINKQNKNNKNNKPNIDAGFIQNRGNGDIVMQQSLFIGRGIGQNTTDMMSKKKHRNYEKNNRFEELMWNPQEGYSNYPEQHMPRGGENTRY